MFSITMLMRRVRKLESISIRGLGPAQVPGSVLFLKGLASRTKRKLETRKKNSESVSVFPQMENRWTACPGLQPLIEDAQREPTGSLVDDLPGIPQFLHLRLKTSLTASQSLEFSAETVSLKPSGVRRSTDHLQFPRENQ